jgi:ABC-type transport system involved in Fe-S cluster assembly fused permease/ATPase subunit
MIFNVFPTILEVAMVGGILSYNLGYPYAVVVASTITAYTVFTVKVSDWRAGETMRRRMMMMMEY